MRGLLPPTPLGTPRGARLVRSPGEAGQRQGSWGGGLDRDDGPTKSRPFGVKTRENHLFREISQKKSRNFVTFLSPPEWLTGGGVWTPHGVKWSAGGAVFWWPHPPAP
eukprot:1194808-Prorocentrum_minimum.AAC.9